MPSYPEWRDPAVIRSLDRHRELLSLAAGQRAPGNIRVISPILPGDDKDDRVAHLYGQVNSLMTVVKFSPPQSVE